MTMRLISIKKTGRVHFNGLLNSTFVTFSEEFPVPKYQRTCPNYILKYNVLKEKRNISSSFCLLIAFFRTFIDIGLPRLPSRMFKDHIPCALMDNPFSFIVFSRHLHYVLLDPMVQYGY